MNTAPELKPAQQGTQKLLFIGGSVDGQWIDVPQFQTRRRVIKASPSRAHLETSPDPFAVVGIEHDDYEKIPLRDGGTHAFVMRLVGDKTCILQHLLDSYRPGMTLEASVGGMGSTLEMDESARKEFARHLCKGGANRGLVILPAP